MRGYLLDTNVVSEAAKPAPHPGVLALLTARDGLWLSVVVVHELEYGVRLMPAGRRRDTRQAILADLMARFGSRVLPIGPGDAGHAARLRADARRAGRTVHLADVLIAGTAAAHDLVIVTRNADDFEAFGIEVLNPWTARGEI